MAAAVAGGQIAMCKHLHSVDCEWDTSACVQAARFGECSALWPHKCSRLHRRARRSDRCSDVDTGTQLCRDTQSTASSAVVKTARRTMACCAWF
eukprot:2507-Heterococcus_DN1.PRE.2